MKIIWDETDKLLQQEYNKRKQHFLNNPYLPKPDDISDEVSFISALLGAYYAVWINNRTNSNGG